jgi:hypothetical protein
VTRVRAALVVACTALLLLLGEVATYASHAGDPSLFVSESEARPGDRVQFSISSTHSDDTYKLFVDTREVKTGSDPAGNGVSDEFKMPDLGSSDKPVSVEAHVTQSGTTTISTRSIQFRASSSSATGPTGPQPQAILETAPLVAQPLQRPRATAPKRRPARRAPSTRKSPTRARQRDSDTRQREKSTKPDRTPAPQSGGSSPTAVANSGASPSRQKRGRSSPAAKPQTPSKPGGPAALTAPAPSSPSPSASSSAVTGVADVGGGGLPIAVIVLLALLLLGALAASVAWAANNWRRAPVDSRDADAVRLAALSRAATAGADFQRTLAQRRASRSTGRAS